MPHLRTILVGALVTAGLTFAACGDSDSGGATADTPSTTMAEPTVKFVSPTDGATVRSTFTAKVDLSAFEIDAADVGKTPKDGMGHLHFSLDDGKYDAPKYSGANGELAVKLGTDGKYSPSVMPQITYTAIPAGKHTLKVDLANNDHSDAGASSNTTFTVSGAQQGATTRGDHGEAVRITDVDTSDETAKITVALSDFAIDAKAVGMAASPNMGHLHFSLDGGKYDTPKYSGANGELAVKLGTDGKYSPAVMPKIVYRGLPAGSHTLKVALANNDHSDTGASATRTFTVR